MRIEHTTYICIIDYIDCQKISPKYIESDMCAELIDTDTALSN